MEPYFIFKQPNAVKMTKPNAQFARAALSTPNGLIADPLVTPKKYTKVISRHSDNSGVTARVE